MTFLEKALDFYTSGEYLNSEFCTQFMKDVARVCIEQNEKNDLPIDVTEIWDDRDNDMIGLLWVLYKLNYQSVTDELLDDMLYCLTISSNSMAAPAMYGRAYVRKYSKDDKLSMLDRMKALVLSKINGDVLCFFDAVCDDFQGNISSSSNPYNRLQMAIHELGSEYFKLSSAIDEDDLYDDDSIDRCIIDGLNTVDREDRRKVITLYANIYKLAAIADINSFTRLTMETRPLPKAMLHELYVAMVRITELEYPDDYTIGKLMTGVPSYITDENIRCANNAVKNLSVRRLNTVDDIYSNSVIASYVEKWSK